MNYFVQDLTNKIKKCRMDLYVHYYLRDIRIQTNNFEFKMITSDNANERLNKNLKQKLEALMNYHLKLAMGIDFPKFYEATAKFFDLVNKALGNENEIICVRRQSALKSRNKIG